MLPFLSAIPLCRSIDGEEAVAVAQSFVARVGITDPGTLETLETNPGKGWGQREDLWMVSLSHRRDRICTVVIASDGTVIAFYSQRRPSEVAGDPSRAKADAQRFATAIASSDAIRIDALSILAGGLFHAEFTTASGAKRTIRFWPDGELKEYEGFPGAR